jgi:hypothetical protein
MHWIRANVGPWAIDSELLGRLGETAAAVSSE